MPDAERPADRDLAAETALAGPPVQPPERPEVPPTSGAVAWVRGNLFNNWYNSLFTVVFGALLAYAISRSLRFLFVTARWEIIDRNLTNLMVFRWPERPDLVRPWVALFLLTAAFGALSGRSARARAERAQEEFERPRLPSLGDDVFMAARRLWPMLLLLVGLWWFSGSPVTAGMLLSLVVTVAVTRRLGMLIPFSAARPATWSLTAVGIGGAYASLALFGGHGWGVWGGLLLTLFLAAAGIILSFPFGVALALGRRSSFPVVRIFSTLYIEVIRGVPLITLLLMGSLMLGFFLPESIASLARTSRSLVAIILFTAAYVAEIVRGGLQSIPRGQIEAAQAVGLSPLKVTRLIVLPQALRNVIPALVGQFISLFKDTSLVSVVGLFELLGVAQAITSQGDFAGQGLLAETLVFVSFVYWVFTYTMSRESQRLETRLGVGTR